MRGVDAVRRVELGGGSQEACLQLWPNGGNRAHGGRQCGLTHRPDKLADKVIVAGVTTVIAALGLEMRRCADLLCLQHGVHSWNRDGGSELEHCQQSDGGPTPKGVSGRAEIHGGLGDEYYQMRRRDR